MDKSTVLRFFLPQKCMICGEISPEDNICEGCYTKFRQLKISGYAREIKHNCFKYLDGCLAFYYYRDAVRQGILRAKYKSCGAFIDGFLKYMDLDFAKFCSENCIDTIISVPAHKSKFYNSEYDLPQQMAHCIAKKHKLQYNKSLIVKVKKTKNQHDLSLVQRKNNLKDAFCLKQDVKGKRILIVDDIISTGYTLEEVARCLKKGGAEAVMAVTFAYNKQ